MNGILKNRLKSTFKGQFPDLRSGSWKIVLRPRARKFFKIHELRLGMGFQKLFKNIRFLWKKIHVLRSLMGLEKFCKNPSKGQRWDSKNKKKSILRKEMSLKFFSLVSAF